MDYLNTCPRCSGEALKHSQSCIWVKDSGDGLEIIPEEDRQKTWAEIGAEKNGMTVDQWKKFIVKSAPLIGQKILRKFHP